ncbi:MAG TPA: hypothetical protein G4O16_10140 [Dehalococcoidia bacterium]|nr:hypothetical protein [Dehalococcoidia bacterium]
MLSLKKASAVIIAEAHNPTIISPEWVRDNLDIQEKPIHFVHTPTLSVFDSNSYMITVDPNRWELITKKLDEASLVSCGVIVKEYTLKLPHITYKSLGLNFIWEYSARLNKENLPELKFQINSLNPSNLFSKQKVKYGGRIQVPFKDYVMSVNIDYKDKKFLIFNYNFSYAIESWGVRRIAKATESFLPMKNISEKITLDMLARKE